MSDRSADQLLTFFLYSLVIYPLTNYILSPKHSYPTWKKIMYAMGFLALVTYAQMWYQAQSEGPNHYQLLQVQRNSPVNVIKKSYRTISLELHPDKNKSPTATDDFQKFNKAFEILTDREKRREYDRLGDYGVRVAAQTVIDHKFLLLQMVIYYSSSLIFSFLLNLSEHNDAFSISLFGLAAMLLLEMLLVLQEMKLPSWFLPQLTPHELINYLRQIYPPFMHGCRCILAVMKVNSKQLRELMLENSMKLTNDINLLITNLFQKRKQLKQALLQQELEQLYEEENQDGDDNDVPSSSSRSLRPTHQQRSMKNNNNNTTTTMASLLTTITRQVQSSKDFKQGVLQSEVKKRMVEALVGKKEMNKTTLERWYLLRNLAIYLLARMILIRSNMTSIVSPIPSSSSGGK